MSEQARIIWEPIVVPAVSSTKEQKWMLDADILISSDDEDGEEDEEVWEKGEVDADDIELPEEVRRALRESGVLSTNEAKVFTLGQLFDLITS